MKAKNIITAAFIALTSLTSCQKSKAETVEQYAIVQMGNYQQDGQTKEPINWIVLTQDGDRVLLMSRNLLSSQPWDVTGTNLTYAGSSIRQWLNNEFTANAFTSEENDAIIPVELDNSDQYEYGTPVGANTVDKVFLLSVREYDDYVKNSNYKTACPTALAVSEGAYTNGQGNAAWWLRSPGMTASSPAYLSSTGDLGTRAHEATETIIGIRPAIWVKATFLDDKEGSAISSVGSPDLPMIFYDLQGNLKTNPARGLYIAKVGNQTKKVFIE